MNAWPFVFAAYGLTIGATLLLVVLSWRAMRRAERDAADLPRR